MTRASACLRVFTPPASSRALSLSPARALLASYHHHPHPSLGPLHVSSILRTRPSPSSQPLPLILLTSDASFSHPTLSTRFTYPRRVLPALDAFYPPLTRLIRPRRVSLVLDASPWSSTRLPHPRRVLSGLPRSRLVDGLLTRFSHRNDFHPLDVLIVPEMDLSATFPLRFGGCPVGTSFLETMCDLGVHRFQCYIMLAYQRLADRTLAGMFYSYLVVSILTYR